jgi:hypothetical protein
VACIRFAKPSNASVNTPSAIVIATSQACMLYPPM